VAVTVQLQIYIAVTGEGPRAEEIKLGPAHEPSRGGDWGDANRIVCAISFRRAPV
jgi:hypothetical protein